MAPLTGNVVLDVRLTPRGGHDEVGEADAEGVLHVRVAAPPADGAANRALVKLLSEALDVPRTSIDIVSGASSRRKRVRVATDAATIQARWPGAAARPG